MSMYFPIFLIILTKFVENYLLTNAKLDVKINLDYKFNLCLKRDPVDNYFIYIIELQFL